MAATTGRRPDGDLDGGRDVDADSRLERCHLRHRLPRHPLGARLQRGVADRRLGSRTGVGCALRRLRAGPPLGIVGQVQLAYQSGYISSAWAIVGNLGSLLALVLVIYLRGSLPALVIALTGTGLVAAAFNGWYLFRRQRPWLMPRLA